MKPKQNNLSPVFCSPSLFPLHHPRGFKPSCSTWKCVTRREPFFSHSRLSLWYSGEAAGGKRHRSRYCAEGPGSREGQGVSKEQCWGTRHRPGMWTCKKTWQGCGWDEVKGGGQAGQHDSQNQLLACHRPERELWFTTSDFMYHACQLQWRISDISRVCWAWEREDCHTLHTHKDAAAQERCLMSWGYLWALIKLDPQDTFIRPIPWHYIPLLLF